MSQYSNQQLNAILTAMLSGGVAGQNVRFFTVPYGSETALFIQVNQPPLPQYGGETSMFGKSLRLLLHLNKTRNLNSWLTMYNVSKVSVTEASNPDASNKRNTTTFTRLFLENTFGQMEKIASSNTALADKLFNTLIEENRNT
jgi:hypothetical protein